MESMVTLDSASQCQWIASPPVFGMKSGAFHNAMKDGDGESVVISAGGCIHMVEGNAPKNEVFVYTGRGGESPLQNVVRALIDPSIATIPARTFYEHKKLTKLELCEGLIEIGEESFRDCELSITKINISTSLRRICEYAFMSSLRTPIRLHDAIESIERGAFRRSIFTNFRIPPIIREHVRVLQNHVFAWASRKRNGVTDDKNVAFPPNTVFGDEICIDEEIYSR